MTRLLLLLLAGCVDGPGLADPPNMPDYETYVTQVQPALDTCANPGCHGQADRPLELYSVGRHRADPADVWVDTPLTDRELLHNYRSVCAFVVEVEDPLDCDLVCKPLAPAAGGCAHEGGVVFRDRTDPDHQLLVAWVSGALEPR